jgi:hypothetical protein
MEKDYVLMCLMVIALLGFGCIAYNFLKIIKVHKTCENIAIIRDAIYEYNIDRFTKTDEWDHEMALKMKNFDDIENDWLDWGYKNILPKEDFEKIKPFIRGGKHGKR